MKLTLILLTLFVTASLPSALAASNMRSITNDKVNIRKGPGTDHEVFYQAPLGYPIQVERSLGDWVLFKDWLGSRGWVHRRLVGNIKTVIVMRDLINLRQGPSVQQPALDKAPRGLIYKVLRTSNGWFHLGYYDTNEAAGWVRSDLVWGQ